MSVKVLTAVWQNSRNGGGLLLVELAIADFAHDDGGGAYPSIPTLAKKARLSERQVQRAIGGIVRSGEMNIDRGAGPHGVNIYTFNLDNLKETGDKRSGDNLSPVPKTTPSGDADVTRGVTPTSPDPLMDPSLIHQGELASDKLSPVNRRKGRVRKPETGWPEGFELNTDLRAYALKHGSDPEFEFEKFHQHAIANDASHRDWSAAFRTWILRSVEFRKDRESRNDTGSHEPSLVKDLNAEVRKSVGGAG